MLHFQLFRIDPLKSSLEKETVQVGHDPEPHHSPQEYGQIEAIRVHEERNINRRYDQQNAEYCPRQRRDTEQPCIFQSIFHMIRIPGLQREQILKPEEEQDAHHEEADPVNPPHHASHTGHDQIIDPQECKCRQAQQPDHGCLLKIPPERIPILLDDDIILIIRQYRLHAGVQCRQRRSDRKQRQRKKTEHNIAQDNVRQLSQGIHQRSVHIK